MEEVKKQHSIILSAPNPEGSEYHFFLDFRYVWLDILKQFFVFVLPTYRNRTSGVQNAKYNTVYLNIPIFNIEFIFSFAYFYLF